MTSNSSDPLRRLRRLPRRVARSARDGWRRADRARDAIGRRLLAARALAHRHEARRRDTRLRTRPTRPDEPIGSRQTTLVLLDHGIAAANRAVRSAPTDLVTLSLRTTEQLGAECDSRLAAAVSGPVAIAGPLVVHPLRSPWKATPRDATVRSRGVALTVRADAPVAVALGAGTTADPAGSPTAVPAVSGAHAVCDRAAVLAVGGIPEVDDPDLAVLELARRLAAVGRTAAVVPTAVVCDHRPVAVASDPDAPFDPAGEAWRALVAAHGPALRRWAGADTATTFAITVAAPSARIADRWGDWHLARALAGALTAAGHRTIVGTLEQTDDIATRAADVHLVIRGLAPVARTVGQRHVLWIISHPATVTVAECDAADLVLVASTRFAEHLRTRTRTPVEVVLQATDVSRFRPATPDPRVTHDVLVVAKSRDVHRRMVADAVAAGLRPAIYGSGWDGLVDPRLVVADRVDNSDLPRLYSSAGVLLNDHWDDMREWGFLSNRLFDALACGTPVISDPVPGVAEVFGDAVVVVEDAESLRTAVATILADPEGARARAARGGDRVRAAHTFDHRAREIVAALVRHGLTPSPTAE